MLEDQGFCGHDAPAARTQKPRQGDEQMDPQNHKIAHASNRTTLEIQQWGIAQRCAPELNFTNSHPTGRLDKSGRNWLAVPMTIRVIRYRRHVARYVIHEFLEFFLQLRRAWRFRSDIPGQLIECTQCAMRAAVPQVGLGAT